MNRTFQAFSDPTRRQIVRMLRSRDMTAGEIADQFDMKRPSISHHLSVLKSANLVQSTRAGQSLVYSLNTTVLDEFVQYVMDRFQIGGDDGDPDTSPDA